MYEKTLVPSSTLWLFIGLASVVIAKWEGVFGTDTEPLPSEEEQIA